MNEELQKKLEALGSDLIDKVQSGAIWATEQTAQFIKEFVAVHIIEHSIYFVLWLIPCVVLFWLLHRANKHIKQLKEKDLYFKDSDDVVNVLRHFCVPAATIILCMNCANNLTEIAKGIWAPRVVLIEKLNDTFRGNNQR